MNLYCISPVSLSTRSFLSIPPFRFLFTVLMGALFNSHALRDFSDPPNGEELDFQLLVCKMIYLFQKASTQANRRKIANNMQYQKGCFNEFPKICLRTFSCSPFERFIFEIDRNFMFSAGRAGCNKTKPTFLAKIIVGHAPAIRMILGHKRSRKEQQSSNNRYSSLKYVHESVRWNNLG